jgi:hypothetical protein
MEIDKKYKQLLIGCLPAGLDLLVVLLVEFFVSLFLTLVMAITNLFFSLLKQTFVGGPV